MICVGIGLICYPTVSPLVEVEVEDVLVVGLLGLLMLLLLNLSSCGVTVSCRVDTGNVMIVWVSLYLPVTWLDSLW